MTEEDEEFERIERESWQRGLYKRMELQPRHTMHEIMEQLADARLQIRELQERITKLEGK